jgi:hypothetical protein
MHLVLNVILFCSLWSFILLDQLLKLASLVRRDMRVRVRVDLVDSERDSDCEE